MVHGNEFYGEFTKMTDKTNRIDLNDLFESTQRRMIAELGSIRQAVEHGSTLGDETEFAWVKFLSKMLPTRYDVSDGFVVDADGWCSNQIDVIVFDRQYSPPLFQAEKVQYVPAEAVYAVFEVKQRIDARNLKAASAKAASVRRLRRTTARIPTADGVLEPKSPHRIIAGVLALIIDKPATFEGMIGRRMAGASEDARLDLGCAIQDGSFTVDYEEANTPVVSVSPGQSSLITFFFQFQTLLQALGTAPAIDYSEYARAANRQV